MSRIDEILARSQAPGRLVERRRFTLSRERAVEKMRRFALRDPHQYVLELIQAAVLHGADFVAVDVSPQAALVAWVGAPAIPAGELETLFDNLFADHAAPGRRHLAQLAIGANAVLQRPLKSLRIESGDGSAAGSVRLELDARGVGAVGQPEAPVQGTYLAARFRRGFWGWLQSDSFTEEEALVEERCRHTPVPILLNGRAPFGWKPRRAVEQPGLEAAETFDTGDCRGVVGVVPRDAGAPPGFAVVVGGVEVARASLRELGALPPALRGAGDPTGLGGVICDDRLRKTADQADIVRDDRYVRMLHAARPAAVRAISRHARRRVALPPLPPLSGDTRILPGAARDVAPVPSPLPQLPPRPPLDLAAVQALRAAGTPVLRMPPSAAPALAALASPAALPLPLLLLDDAQSRGLAEALDADELPRIAQAADLEVARRMVSARPPLAQAEAPAVALDVPVFARWPARPGARWALELHAGPGAPAVAAAGSVVVCWTDTDGAPRVAQGGPPGLPRLVARWEGPPLADGGPALCWRAAAAAVALLPQGGPAPGGDPAAERALRDLVVGLLAWAAVPCWGDPAAGIRLRLPPAWGPWRATLLGWPVARDTGGRPVTVAALAQLVGTPRTVCLAAGADAADRLLAAWGPGHVHRPGPVPRLLALAGGAGGAAWRRCPVDDPEARIVVGAWRRPPGRPAIEGQRGPLSWLWWTAPRPEGARAEDETGALALALHHLGPLLARPPADWSPGARAAARCAAAELAAELGELDDQPLLLPPQPGPALQCLPQAAAPGWAPLRPALGGLQPVLPALLSLRGAWGRWSAAETAVVATGLRGRWGPDDPGGTALVWGDRGPAAHPCPAGHGAVLCATPAGELRLGAVLGRTLAPPAPRLPAPARVLPATGRPGRPARKALAQRLQLTALGAGLVEGQPRPSADHPLSTLPGSEAQWALVLALAAAEPGIDLVALQEDVIDMLSPDPAPPRGA